MNFQYISQKGLKTYLLCVEIKHINKKLMLQTYVIIKGKLRRAEILQNQIDVIMKGKLRRTEILQNQIDVMNGSMVHGEMGAAYK